MLRDQPREAPGEADQPARVLGDHLDVGARLVVEAVEVRVGDQLQQVLVALEVFRDQPEVIVAFAVLGLAGLFETRLFHEVHFATDQGLDALVLGRLVELDRAKHVSMVRQRDGLHAQLGRARHQAVDLTRAIEQTVVGVEMEMDETGIGRRHAAKGCRPRRPRKRGNSLNPAIPRRAPARSSPGDRRACARARPPAPSGRRGSARWSPPRGPSTDPFRPADDSAPAPPPAANA